jgi:hypothetical protein
MLAPDIEEPHPLGKLLPADAPVVVIAAGRCHTLSRSTAIEWNWQHLLNPVRLRIDKSN